MIINEKGLVKAMKEAYRGTGYTVAAVRRQHELEQLVIVAQGWLMKINRAQCPRDILGLIVAHSGMLPRVGEAYRVMKDYVQAAIFEKVLGSLESCENNRREDCPCLAQTKLHMNGNEVWQAVTTREITLLDPCFTRMVDKTGAACSQAENMACFVGQLAEVYIMAIGTNDKTVQEEIHHLATMQWVGK